MSGASAEFTGGCRCGAVRFRATAEPVMTRVCWCRDCQYLGAGSGTVNVIFPKSSLTISGALSEYASTAASGSVMRRSFCPLCGTPLFSEAEHRPHLIIARAGSLDDPNRVAPTMTIWTASAPTWACLDSSLPQLAGQPPPSP
jgi:hypothetical protein